jgi:hypothetical protein
MMMMGTSLAAAFDDFMSSRADDDYGGFYDHVPNPPAPNDESPCNVCQGLEPGAKDKTRQDKTRKDNRF